MQTNLNKIANTRWHVTSFVRRIHRNARLTGETPAVKCKNPQNESGEQLGGNLLEFFGEVSLLLLNEAEL